MSKTLHFKIKLLDIKPVIWRQFQVTDDYRFDRFHQVIQIVMGWTNSHLHEFRVKDRHIGILFNDGFDMAIIEDGTTLYLKDLALQKGETLVYLYDFGDNWEHALHLEEISDNPLSNPICTAGESACPPEDCGGIWGYSDMLEIIKDPGHQRYEDMMEWLSSPFDPTVFSVDKVNKELKKFGAWHRKHPRAKSTPWHKLG
ncbi:MAG: plasmid pRiA4b ORF-3 family protein [Saprospiraceae bacterium]